MKMKMKISEALTFHNLNDLLMTANAEDTNTADLIILPSHHRCVSHTLNLIAVKDSEKPLDNNILYQKKYKTIFTKLSKLWSKQNQSTQVADKMKEYCGVYLKTLIATRWNSTFDSVLQLVTLLKSDTETINKCLDYCDLQRLTDDEIKFFEEYCQVMEPLARALDILQGDTAIYMGYLLPVLTTLQQKLETLSKSNLRNCHSLVLAIQQGLNKRFLTTFGNKELIIASCLHPKFKLYWLTGEKKNLLKVIWKIY